MLDKSLDWSKATRENFKWFIEERERIRLKKEAGESRPWTTDEILHKTKFTNIFRQHDKTSKFIFDKVNHLQNETLFENIVIARLINRIDILKDVLPCTTETDLSFLIDTPIMNSSAYQIAPNLAATHGRTTNREVIIYDIRKYTKDAYIELLSTTNLTKAADKVNKALKGCLRFAAMQMVMDYDYLTNSHPDKSNLFIGEGAKPIINKLGPLEELCSILNMSPIDIEHAACEYRKYIYRHGKNLKYYSYKPNSMGI